MPSDTKNKEPAGVTPQKTANNMAEASGKSDGSEGTPIQTNVQGAGAKSPSPQMTPDRQGKTAGANPGNPASPNTANKQNINSNNSAANSTPGGINVTRIRTRGPLRSFMFKLPPKSTPRTLPPTKGSKLTRTPRKG